jgi:hypothetical protein
MSALTKKRRGHGESCLALTDDRAGPHPESDPTGDDVERPDERTGNRWGRSPGQNSKKTPDRRAASKRRLKDGIRCFKTFNHDVDTAEMLKDLGYAVGTSHADVEYALQEFLDELVEDHKRVVAGDTSPQGSLRCAILPDDLNC